MNFGGVQSWQAQRGKLDGRVTPLYEDMYFIYNYYQLHTSHITGPKQQHLNPNPHQLIDAPVASPPLLSSSLLATIQSSQKRLLMQCNYPIPNLTVVDRRTL